MPVSHLCSANADAIINISRKRLCKKSSKETIIAWQLFLDALSKIEPEIVNACKPECQYRNGCQEMTPCKELEELGK